MYLGHGSFLLNLVVRGQADAIDMTKASPSAHVPAKRSTGSLAALRASQRADRDMRPHEGERRIASRLTDVPPW
jgi:hypothetical protein